MKKYKLEYNENEVLPYELYEQVSFLFFKWWVPVTITRESYYGIYNEPLAFSSPETAIEFIKTL